MELYNQNEGTMKSQTVKGIPKVFKTVNRSTSITEKHLLLILFVLRFYGPVNPMGSCRARSVYLTTRLLGKLSPLSG